MTKKNQSKERMTELFERSGFDLDITEIEKFWKYYELLIEFSEELDLTRLKRFEDIIIKHFIDSIYVTKLCELPSPLIDIGSGAGLPGIPLKIIIPDLQITLAEPRHRRIAFMKTVIDRLELEDIEIYPHMVTDNSFFDVKGVITRALESTDKTLSRVSHFLPKAGRVILMKGPAVDEELSVISEKNIDTFRSIQDRGYTLPGTSYRRRILIFRKTSSKIKITYKIFHDPNENTGHAISSKENRYYRETKRLTDVDGIRKYGKAIISGKKQILETVKDLQDLAVSLIIYDGYSEDNSEINEIIKKFSLNGLLYILKKGLYNEIDIFNTGGPLLVTSTPSIAQWDYSLEPGCNLLVPFQDPANVGAVIRSAVGFGVRRIILLKEAAHPFHLKGLRTSGCAVFRALLYRGPSINELLPISEEKNLDIITLDQGGKDIDTFQFPDKFLLLPGIEGPGLPESLRKRSISIPISGDIESLNAAIAASIAMFSWRSKMQ